MKKKNRKAGSLLLCASLLAAQAAVAAAQPVEQSTVQTAGQSAVSIAVQQGILRGDENGSYQLQQPVTWAECCAMTLRAMQQAGMHAQPENVRTAISWVPAEHWAYPEMNVLYQQQVLREEDKAVCALDQAIPSVQMQQLLFRAQSVPEQHAWLADRWNQQMGEDYPKQVTREKAVSVIVELFFGIGEGGDLFPVAQDNRFRFGGAPWGQTPEALGLQRQNMTVWQEEALQVWAAQEPITIAGISFYPVWRFSQDGELVSGLYAASFDSAQQLRTASGTAYQILQDQIAFAPYAQSDRTFSQLEDGGLNSANVLWRDLDRTVLSLEAVCWGADVQPHAANSVYQTPYTLTVLLRPVLGGTE